MIKMKKKKFWDICVFGILISFGIILLSTIFLSSEQLEMTIIVYPWLIIYGVGILFEITLTFGMIYYAFKRKSYLWMIIIIFLGTIFPLIFYFTKIRKDFEKENKNLNS